MPLTLPPEDHAFGQRVSKANQKWFYENLRKGHNPYKLGEMAGWGRSTTNRMIKKRAQHSASKLHVPGERPADDSESPMEIAKRLAQDGAPIGEFPEPRRSYDELIHPQAQQAWNEFGYYRHLLLGRRHIPWQIEMVQVMMGWMELGKRMVEIDEGSYVKGILNTPPGGGKTTTVTHDFPSWAITRNRDLRVALGHHISGEAQKYVRRLRKTFQANVLLNIYFGRFKPLDPELWRQDQFVVDGVEGKEITTEYKLAIAGFDFDNPMVRRRLEDPNDSIHEVIGEIENYFLAGEKEPTVQAFSRDKQFIGQRVDLNLWDDLVSKRNSSTPEQREDLTDWWFSEAETRTEPGGIVALIGTRYGKFDLYRHCRDMVYQTEDDVEDQLLTQVSASFTEEEMQQIREDLEKEMVDKYGYDYAQLVTPVTNSSQTTGELRTTRRIYQYYKFPAHDDAHCKTPDSIKNKDHIECVLDPKRFSYRHLMQAQANDLRRYKLTFQQEDESTEDNLIQLVWLTGGLGNDNVVHPGCYDYQRKLLEIPEADVIAKDRTYSIATVDPSSSNWWSIQWYLFDQENDVDYLIDLERARLKADGFLSYDPKARAYKGIANDWQNRSVDMGWPIRLWVIEGVAAQKYLYEHTFVLQWMKEKQVLIKGHTTGRNKVDEDYGVENIRPRFRLGKVNLPFNQDDLRTRVKVNEFAKELQEYPDGAFNDQVMSYWFLDYTRQILVPSMTVGQSAPRHHGTVHPYADSMPGYVDPDSRQARRSDGERQPRHLQPSR